MRKTESLKVIVFVPYRGFYFLNEDLDTTAAIDGWEFSSPIGAFIFLINCWVYCHIKDLKVFVPYRGFYFLNAIKLPFSYTLNLVFVPYRGFYFLNENKRILLRCRSLRVFVPYRGFYFLN